MIPQPRALIAVQPAAWPLVQDMLGDMLELVPVYTIPEALGVLKREHIDLIVASLTFSDSRTLEFLVAVKADPATAPIPFLCCRLLVGILSEKLVESLGRAAKLIGAADFVNLGALPPHEGRAALRAAASGAIAARGRPSSPAPRT